LIDRLIDIEQQPSVVVLGGAGGMGRMAATIVSSYADLGELVIADLDLQAAEQLVAELAPTAKTNLRAARIDVTDTVALQALLQDLQVVLNTTGPFYRLGTVVLEAAITARCHYMDICDDWEPTTQLLAFNDKAKAAGVLAIIGLGASAGDFESPGAAGVRSARSGGQLVYRLVGGRGRRRFQPQRRGGCRSWGFGCHYSLGAADVWQHRSDRTVAACIRVAFGTYRHRLSGVGCWYGRNWMVVGKSAD